MTKRKHSRSGFSLIEALVVLAIGGMALAIIFSIGVKAGDSGFRLGRRAMAVADTDIAISDTRSLIRSIAVRPPETANDAVDRPIEGRPDLLEADIVAERASQCAPLGWSGRLRLSVETAGAERRLVCEAGGRRAVLLATTDRNAALSYSTDGTDWNNDFRSLPRQEIRDGGMKSTGLFVRFRGGAVDLVEHARSGRPQSWIRFDDPL
ncbi:prepilin-type N-terminal cleavage/methylation domain-containing protein [Pseudomonas sp. ODNR1LW]|nr:prepilin-type N-terminal cleavage/methylation domain-containing protein [Pseudomonas sp. ODNR1LW]